jgi:hypothetical protein
VLTLSTPLEATLLRHSSGALTRFDTTSKAFSLQRFDSAKKRLDEKQLLSFLQECDICGSHLLKRYMVDSFPLLSPECLFDRGHGIIFFYQDCRNIFQTAKDVSVHNRNPTSSEESAVDPR